MLTIVASLATLLATAQEYPNVAIGVGEGESITMPTSSIAVDMKLTNTTFRAGVYARYASKYLGERASLSDRETATIDEVRLAIAPNDYFVASAEVDSAPEVVVRDARVDLPIDRTSANAMLPEQAAQRAAQRVFDNRKISQDLISGDVGEGVFGAGLVAALDRLDRMESEYLALFMGHEESVTTTQRFIVNLNPQTERYIICRYDNQKGILPASGLVGDPVYLQITPAEVSDSILMLTPSKSAPNKTFIVPNPAQCDLYVGANVETSAVLPLYDFGYRMTVYYKK